MVEQNPDPSHTRGNSGEERPRSAILRLLDSDSNYPLDDPELRRELSSMVGLMQRLEELAERQLSRAAEMRPETLTGPEPEGEVRIGGHLVAFDPAEISQPPQAASPIIDQPGVEPQQQKHDQQPAHKDEPATAKEDESDDHLQRWWVHFNGDVSLERLARLRTVIGESPFTIDARFDEITDGLIVMRFVTERHLTMEQVDWIVRQVMDVVGLDREAAILSRN